MTTSPHDKIVIENAAEADSQVTCVAAQMGANAGYDIVRADDAIAVCDQNAAGSVELLVLRGAGPRAESALDRLATLPAGRRPRNVAILTDEATDSDALLTRKVPGTKVHLFVTPLQAYGLLNVIRRIRRQALQTN